RTARSPLEPKSAKPSPADIADSIQYSFTSQPIKPATSAAITTVRRVMSMYLGSETKERTSSMFIAMMLIATRIAGIMALATKTYHKSTEASTYTGRGTKTLANAQIKKRKT